MVSTKFFSTLLKVKTPISRMANVIPVAYPNKLQVKVPLPKKPSLKVSMIGVIGLYLMTQPYFGNFVITVLNG